MAHLVYVACLLLSLMFRAAFVEIIALIFRFELSCLDRRRINVVYKLG